MLLTIVLFIVFNADMSGYRTSVGEDIVSTDTISFDNPLTIFAATLQEITHAKRVLKETVFEEIGTDLDVALRQTDEGRFMLECFFAGMVRNQFLETAQVITAALVNDELKAQMSDDWEKPHSQIPGFKIVIADSVFPN